MPPHLNGCIAYTPRQGTAARRGDIVAQFGETTDIHAAPRALGLAEWRAVINASFVPLQIDEIDGVPFRGHLEKTVVEDITVFEVTATPHLVTRTQELIERSPGRFYKLSLQLVGTAVLEQDGRRADLRPGDLAIYDTHRPYTLSFPEKNRAMVIMFPQEVVDLPRDEICRVTATRFPSDEGLGRVINPFFVELGRNMDQIDGPHAARLVHSALDLLVTMLSQELRRDMNHGLALNREVREYILQHLGDPHLNPAAIAAAHYISTRHLYTIFTEEGQTVSAWIRSRRLERIRRDLADPLLADRPLSAIAARWGLVDAAHFSRLFRADFGESPSAYRARLTGS